jgi:hypothetical protein
MISNGEWPFVSRSWELLYDTKDRLDPTREAGVGPALVRRAPSQALVRLSYFMPRRADLWFRNCSSN